MMNAVKNWFSKMLKLIRLPFAKDKIWSFLFLSILIVPLLIVQGLGDNIEIPKLLVWLVSLCGASFYLARRKNFIPISKTLAWLLSLFVVWTAIAVGFGFDPINSIFGLYGRLNISLVLFGIFSLSIFLFSQINDKEKINFLLATVVFCSAIISLLGITQFWGFAFYQGLSTQVRLNIPSLLGNPNFSSMLVAMAIGPSLYLLNKSLGIKRIYYFTCLAVSLVGIGFFNSRGAILATVLSLFVYCLWYLLRKDWKNVVGSGLIILLVILLGTLFISASRGNLKDKSSDLGDSEALPRILVWEHALNFSLAHPLVGTGPGNYYLEYEKNALSSLVNDEIFDDVHNVFLQLSTQIGIAGLIIFMIILILPLLRAYLDFRKLPSVAGAFIAGIIAWIVAGSFNPVVQATWLVLAFYLAMLWRLTQRSPAIQTQKLSQARRLALYTFFIFGLLIAVSLPLADYFNIASASSYYAKQYDKSIRFATWATYLNPFYSSPYNYKIASMIAKGTKAETIEKVIERKQSYQSSYSRTNWYTAAYYYKIYLREKDPSYLLKSQKFVERALESGPNFPYLYYFNSYIAYLRSDYHYAQVNIRKALALRDDSLVFWSLSAKIEQALGNKDSLIASLKEAYKLEKNSKAYPYFIMQAEKATDVTKINIPIEFSDFDF